MDLGCHVSAAGTGCRHLRRYLCRLQAQLAAELPTPAHEPAGRGAGGIQYGLDGLGRRHVDRRGHARGKLAEAERPERDLLIVASSQVSHGRADNQFLDWREAAVVRALGGPV